MRSCRCYNWEMKDCIFCKIIKGKIPAKKINEMTNVIAFEDANPSADTHILVVPKRHIETFMDINKEDNEVLVQMLRISQDLIKSEKLEKKYKLVINGGEYQFVPHLHWHLLGGEMKKEAK